MGEELGTSARVGRLLGSVEFDHGGEHFVLYAYETEIDEVGATPMHDEVRWVSPDDVYDYDLADSDRLLARTLRMLSP
jgi:8-oxo-dGTP pyrophosphatase MutT (NUDIX family)